MMQKMSTKKMTTLAMLSVMAYVVTFLARSFPPMVLFLRYDPKDIIITIGGFLFGPLAAFLITLVVSTVEMFTVGQSGPVGLMMNVISGSAFACTASFIYKHNRTMKGAMIGLVSGVLLMTTLMVLWNYLITPLFLGIPREQVVSMLVPTIMPFNIIKGGLNAAFTILLYKPIRTALAAANMMPRQEEAVAGKINLGVMMIAGFVVISCVLWVMAINGRI